MRTTSRFGLTVFIFVAGLAAGRLTHAQAVTNQPPAAPPAPGVQVPQPIPPSTANIISGNDIGFRIDGRRGNPPVGTLVVRVNGQWVEVDFGTSLKRLT